MSPAPVVRPSASLGRGARRVMAILALGLLPAHAAHASGYPEKPVRLIVPFATGGTTDTLARQYADLLGRALGQSVIVDNRPGASGNIGNRIVADAQPDGYTLLFGSGQMTQTVTFGPFPAVQPGDLAPVSMLASSPQIIATPANSAYQDVASLIAAARKAPGTISMATAQLHLYAGLLNQRAGIDLLHVPYKGGAPALVDTVSGRTDLVMSQSPNLLQYLESGQLRALGILARERLAILPEVPTFEEAGVPDLEIVSWFGLFAPKGTPAAIVARLEAETRKAIAAPAMDTLARQGLKLEASTPQELGRRVTRDTAYWKQLASENPDLTLPR